MPTLTKTEVMEIVAYCKENMFDTMTDSRSWASASGIFTSPRSAGKTGEACPPRPRPLDHGKFFNFDPQGILTDGVIFISAYYFLEALILRTLSPVSSI